MAKNNKNKTLNLEKISNFLSAIKEKYFVYDILALIFVFLGIFTILADLEKGGRFGFFYKEFLTNVFGISHLALIIIFLILGIGWLLKLNLVWKITSTIGWIILFLIFATFSEMLFQSGGIIGKWILSYEIYLGRIGFIVFLILLSFVCISIIFEKPLRDIFLEIYEKVKKEKKVEVESYIEKKEKAEKTFLKEKVKMPNVIKPTRIKQEISGEIRLKKLPIKTSWELPPISLLDKTETQPDSGDIKENIQIIKTTLQNFGINAEITEVTIGPTVTRYALKPPEGVKLSKILALQNDLALALAVQNIRIEAPIPGRALIGIEVPNVKTAIVR
ncbi:MAG: DNA translocase FtsK, partial [Thermoplasmata archaeon]